MTLPWRARWVGPAATADAGIAWSLPARMRHTMNGRKRRVPWRYSA